MKTNIKLVFTMIMVIIFAASGCKKIYDDEKVVVRPVGSEKIRFERNDGGTKNLMAGAVADNQVLLFAGKGINTFFYLEDETGNALNGDWTITETTGGTGYYVKNGIDQIMYNFPNNGDYKITLAGTNPSTGLTFSHTFYVRIGATTPTTAAGPVKWVSTVAINGGWQITMKFFLTPGGLGTVSAPYGHAWVNEAQPSLYNQLPLTFVGDSTLVTFNIMNTSNNLYYTNNSGTRFKFNYLVKSTTGDGTSGNNGTWATPTGEFFASNLTGSGQMFEFYINLANGVITTPGGSTYAPGSVNFNMPGSVGDNIFRAQKIGSTMYFWSSYPTATINSSYKRAQYKVGVSGTWINFPSTPIQFNGTEYFGSNIAYSTVSGVGDVYIRFGEEIGGVFTTNSNAASSPSYDIVAGGFSFR